MIPPTQPALLRRRDGELQEQRDLVLRGVAVAVQEEEDGEPRWGGVGAA